MADLRGELVVRARAGDTAAFAALCEQHRGRLWRIAGSVARGADLEDLAQETIVRAFAALHSYRGEAPFDAWLCRIAVNVAHDYLRSAWKRRVLVLDFGAGDPRPAEAPEGEAERRELQRRVRRAVARLPENQCVPIWMHYFEGYSLAEVARLEGASEATVRSRVKAGLKRLSLSLGDLLAEEEPLTAARGGAPVAGATLR